MAEGKIQTLGETNGLWLVAIKFITAMAVPTMLLVVSLQVWLVLTIFELKEEQAVAHQWQEQTERDRFRREDALTLEVKLTKDISLLWQAIGELKLKKDVD